MIKKDHSKQDRGAFVYLTEITSNNIAFLWYDNKAVKIVSLFASVDPVNTVRHYDQNM